MSASSGGMQRTTRSCRCRSAGSSGGALCPARRGPPHVCAHVRVCEPASRRAPRSLLPGASTLSARCGRASSVPVRAGPLDCARALQGGLPAAAAGVQGPRAERGASSATGRHAADAAELLRHAQGLDVRRLRRRIRDRPKAPQRCVGLPNPWNPAPRARGAARHSSRAWGAKHVRAVRGQCGGHVIAHGLRRDAPARVPRAGLARLTLHTRACLRACRARRRHRVRRAGRR